MNVACLNIATKVHLRGRPKVKMLQQTGNARFTDTIDTDGYMSSKVIFICVTCAEMH